MKIRSLTFHQGSRLSQAHNTRNEKVCGKQTHIDHSRTAQNEILVHEPIPDAYHRLFDAALKTWNAGQKNAERRIQNYLAHIKKDGNGKKPAYEVVVQVGTAANSGTDDEDAAAVMREYTHAFQHRNPTLELIGAYIHRDEACTHLHLDYIPVARATRGMETQVSLTGALRELGYIGKNRNNTAQMQFQMAERAELARLARQHGIEIVQNVVSVRREHLETEKYKEMAAKIDDYQSQIREKAQNLRQNYEKIQEVEKNINTHTHEMQAAEATERRRAENIAALRAANDRELARQLRRAEALAANEPEADSMQEFLAVTGLSEKYTEYRAQRAQERTRALSAALDGRIASVLRHRTESVVER